MTTAKFSELQIGDKLETVDGEIATVLSLPERGVIKGRLSVSLSVPSLLVGRTWVEEDPEAIVTLV